MSEEENPKTDSEKIAEQIKAVAGFGESLARIAWRDSFAGIRQQCMEVIRGDMQVMKRAGCDKEETLAWLIDGAMTSPGHTNWRIYLSRKVVEEEWDKEEG